MAKLSTRNKVRFQGNSAYADLKKAMNHLVQLGALAGGGSKIIDNDLPLIVSALEMITIALDKLNQDL